MGSLGCISVKKVKSKNATQILRKILGFIWVKYVLLNWVLLNSVLYCSVTVYGTLFIPIKTCQYINQSFKFYFRLEMRPVPLLLENVDQLKKLDENSYWTHSNLRH
jgi:hypothetical protein